MNLTLKLVILCTVYLNIVYVWTKSFDENMEEWNQVVPGIDFPVRCPEKGKHFAKIYYEDDFLNIQNVSFNKEPLADNGIYILRNISLNDTNDYVCVYREPDIEPYTIHVMVIAGDPFDYLNHTEVYHPGVPMPTPGFSDFTILEQYDHLKSDEDAKHTQREETVHLKDSYSRIESDSSMEENISPEDYRDESNKMSHDQLGDYNVGPAVNTTGLVPPSLPEVKKISSSCVQISWKIKLHKGSPVSHYTVQHLKSLSTHGVGGGNFWINSKDISPVTTWCKLDQLTPKYWYRFRVAAVFYNKGQEIKVYGPRSDWLKLM